jgi:hypothetical protein
MHVNQRYKCVNEIKVIKCQINTNLRQSLLKSRNIQMLFKSMNSPKECKIKSRPQNR